MEALDLPVAIAGVGGTAVVADTVGAAKGGCGATKFGTIVSTEDRRYAEGGDDGGLDGSGNGSGGSVRDELEQAELAEAINGGK